MTKRKIMTIDEAALIQIKRRAPITIALPTLEALLEGIGPEVLELALRVTEGKLIKLVEKRAGFEIEAQEARAELAAIEDREENWDAWFEKKHAVESAEEGLEWIDKVAATLAATAEPKAKAA